MILKDLFPGNMGRVLLTRVAIRLRMPNLMKMDPAKPLAPQLAEQLRAALDDVKRG